MTDNARLMAAWGDLDRATLDYHKARTAYLQGQRLGKLTDEYKAAFEVAIFRHEKSSKAFNQELSATIKAAGELPAIAEDALYHQRYNGFHAKGLAKIIEMNKKTKFTIFELELPLNQQEKK